MKKLVDILQYVLSFLQAIWSAMIGMLDDLQKMTTLLGQAVVYIYNVIDSLPAFLKSFAFVTIFIAILFQVLHREQGGDF